MSYRADLDGLRAIAVLLVLGYHALMPGFTRGYLGVDIFFVLSGYLIAQGIFTQLSQGTFCLKAFYTRRLRRILPALLVMLMITTIAVCSMLYPPELAAFAESLLAATLQVSNLYFLSITNYFAEGNGAKPLLHTWSLGVEEQFYLIFPLLCLLIRAKAANRFRTCLLAGATLSFTLSLWQSHTAPAAGFFSPLSRAWQLLAGALLARDGWPSPTRRTREAASLLGLGLIAVAVAYPPFGTTPAPANVPVTLGACLLIWSGKGASGGIQRLLGLKPLVFIGMISYSLYLWHWPILRLADRPLVNALASLGALESLNAGLLRLMLLALSFGVAILSWHFIEKPFRHTIPSKRAIRLTLSGSACAGLVATALIGLQGWPQRFPPEVSRMASYLQTPHPEYLEHQCFMTSRSQEKTFQTKACLSDAKGWALLGDSHAAHLAHGMRNHFGAISQITASGCKPFLQPLSSHPSPCEKLVATAYAEWLWPARIKGVIIAARWRAGDEAALTRSVKALEARGLAVHVIGPQPQYYYEVPLILAGGHEHSALELPRLRALDQSFAAQLPKGRYHSVFQKFCADGPCPLQTPSGTPVAFDYSHLTAEGSTMLVTALTHDPRFPRRASP